MDTGSHEENASNKDQEHDRTDHALAVPPTIRPAGVYCSIVERDVEALPGGSGIVGPNFFTNRGDSYQLKGELGAALSDYEAALRLDPNFAQTYNNRGQRPAHHDRGDREIRR
ncbi:hypothetical protein XI09_36570 [Bradyrhizobium sp. CCBAU 11386]|nr:hypothetical protein [Bradyrhizobium sp. CCBAU 11386]